MGNPRYLLKQQNPPTTCMHACVHKHTHTHASTCRPLLTEPHGPNHPLTHPHPPPDLEQAKVTITHLFTGWRWSSLYLKQIPCPPQGFLRSVAQGFWSQGHNRIHTVQEGSHSRTTNHCSHSTCKVKADTMHQWSEEQSSGFRLATRSSSV